MKIVISGAVPSLKNSKQLFVNRRTGKSFITSSQLSKQWVADALWQIKQCTPVEDYPVAVTMVFYFKDKRRRDLDNSCSSVLDVIKTAGVIIDDDYQHVCPITIDFGGVDNLNPRVEIYIDEP